LTTSDTAPKAGTALRPGTELELAFTDLLANGQAVGRAGGMVVFCFGPLPAERARVRIAQRKQRYAVADLLEVLDPSPDRSQPFCSVFGSCGGCQLQHLNYSAQLAWKRDLVREALQRIGGLTSIAVEETIGMAQPRAYRNKMSLVVDHSRTPFAIGFYRQRSHEVVSIEGCPIVTPKLDADLKGIVQSSEAEPVRAMLGDARHLVARSAAATDQSVLTITTERRSENARRAAPVLLATLPGLAGVSNSFDLNSANAIVGRNHSLLGGRPEIEETIDGLRYRISTASFFQVNAEMLAKIFAYLEPWLGGSRSIVDLYCGAGTFSLFFARHGWKVYGVEENAQAIAEAEANASRNDLEACFKTGRVEELVGAAPLRDALQTADVVFLDPPRKGCDELTLGAIAAAGVSELWYLSCDPATLARDSKFLAAKGYRLRSVQPFDMFPQTGHVETLVRLELA